MNYPQFLAAVQRRQAQPFPHYPERVTFNDAVRDPSMTLDEFAALVPRYVRTELQPDGRDIPPEDFPHLWKSVQYERAYGLARSMPDSQPLNDRLRIARELFGLGTLGL